jgi:aspartate aminotransferase
MQRIVAELTEASVDMSIYTKRKDTFKKVLDVAGIEYNPVQGAFYMFCKVPNRKNGEQGTDSEFVEHLKKHLILGVPGSSFGRSGWLRFAYCVDEKIINTSKVAFVNAMKEW